MYFIFCFVHFSLVHVDTAAVSSVETIAKAPSKLLKDGMTRIILSLCLNKNLKGVLHCSIHMRRFA